VIEAAHRRARFRWGTHCLVLGVVILAAGGALLAWRWAGDAADRRQGLALAKQGRFADAEPFLRRVVERHDNDLEVVRALALGYVAADDASNAEGFLTRWCELRPDQSQPFEQRMALEIRMKWLEQAIADGRHVLELAPERDDLRQKVAGWLMEDGLFTEAEQECRRCLEQRPTHPELVYLLAQIYHKQGRIAEATPLADSLLRAFPKEPNLRLLRAMLHYDAGQPDQAVPLLREVLARQPAHETAQYYLGLALARVGKKEEARQLLGPPRLRGAREQP
jgi:predicted Zn-dependent protease